MGGVNVKENEMYKYVKELLEGIGYDVYAEVEVNSWGGSGRADVIGYQKPAVCIVEMKTSLSMELIEQAYKWKRFGHYIYIAIPKRKKQIPTFVCNMLSSMGIGIIEVGDRVWGTRIVLKAKFNRPYKNTKWDDVLKPEHQTWLEGGSSGGGYVTNYKLTIDRVKRYLKMKRGWVSMNELLDHCETHYSNPKNSLAKALREFESNWCETKVINRRVHFKYKEGK
jgi:hypothetical protein